MNQDSILGCVIRYESFSCLSGSLLSLPWPQHALPQVPTAVGIQYRASARAYDQSRSLARLLPVCCQTPAHTHDLDPRLRVLSLRLLLILSFPAAIRLLWRVMHLPLAVPQCASKLRPKLSRRHDAMPSLYLSNPTSHCNHMQCPAHPCTRTLTRTSTEPKE